jgi:hypothetical protein
MNKNKYTASCKKNPLATPDDDATEISCSPVIIQTTILCQKAEKTSTLPAKKILSLSNSLLPA